MQGIFTTIKVLNGIPLYLNKHVERLLSIKYQVLSIKYTKQFLRKKLIEIIKHKKVQGKTVALRIDILNSGDLLYKVRKLPKSGQIISAITLIPQEPLPKTKQIERRAYEMAQIYAKKKNAAIALFAQNGNLLESTISNIVSIDQNGNMITPPLSSQGLKGIARQILIEKRILFEKEISDKTTGPLVLINSLRVEGIKSINGVLLINPADLIKKLEKLLS